MHAASCCASRKSESALTDMAQYKYRTLPSRASSSDHIDITSKFEHTTIQIPPGTNLNADTHPPPLSSDANINGLFSSSIMIP